VCRHNQCVEIGFKVFFRGGKIHKPNCWWVVVVSNEKKGREKKWSTDRGSVVRREFQTKERGDVLLCDR